VPTCWASLIPDLAASVSSFTEYRRRKLKPFRRRFIISVVNLVPVVGLSRLACAAADTLPESDASAAALGYRVDASKVDKAKFPKFMTGQYCSNCQFYQGGSSDEMAGCLLFGGRRVSGTGWCNGYTHRS
jgi:hypothetical protein